MRPSRFVESFERPNLHFSVGAKSGVADAVADILAAKRTTGEVRGCVPPCSLCFAVVCILRGGGNRTAGR